MFFTLLLSFTILQYLFDYLYGLNFSSNATFAGYYTATAHLNYFAEIQ